MSQKNKNENHQPNRKTSPTGLNLPLGEFFQENPLVILVLKHWTDHVTVNEAQVTRFSDLPGASRTILEGAEAPVNAVRGWPDSNCLQSSHRPFSCLPASCSYCGDTFCFALWIMWAFKRFAPFLQEFIREKKCLF